MIDMKLAVALLMVIGGFLLFDSLIFHGLSFDYSVIGLEWLDAYVSHWMIGVALLIAGVIAYEFDE